MRNLTGSFVTRIVLCWFALGFLGLLPSGAQLVPPIEQNSAKQKLGRQMTEGYSLIDGDIQMPTWFVEAVLRGETPDAALFRDNLWPNGLVPFEFETACAPTSTCTNAPDSGWVPPADRTRMIAAMAELETVANVNFIQCPSNDCGESNHVLVRDSTNDTTASEEDNSCRDNSGNSSPVGMIGGQQILNVVSWPARFVIVHELMHALGFYHEHQRPDRDTYVAILCFNVRGGCQGTLFNENFPILNTATIYGAYDFDSVMHYGQCAFAINLNCPNDFSQTISVREPYTTQWQNAIGQTTHLSALDQATVSFLYPQLNWRFLDCSFSGAGSDGTIRRPYTTLSTALANTPAGGTLWVSGPCPTFPAGTYSNNITIRAAPNILVRFGG